MVGVPRLIEKFADSKSTMTEASDALDVADSLDPIYINIAHLRSRVRLKEKFTDRRKKDLGPINYPPELNDGPVYPELEKPLEGANPLQLAYH